jgi:RNA polymerase sigma-70 factor (ECF subfamily)
MMPHRPQSGSHPKEAVFSTFFGYPASKAAKEETANTLDGFWPMEESMNRVLSRNRDCDAPAVEKGQEMAWITACQQGDSVAFNRLVLKWEKPIYNLTLRMLQDRDEAAEAAQEVFCSAFKNIRRFRRDAKFSTWLYRIAVNQCITRLRKRPPGVHLSLDDQGPDAPLKGWTPTTDSHEEALMLLEQRRRVRLALDNLPEEQRAIVELKFYQDLTFEEIADVVQVPLSTIKSRLYAGLAVLKSRLGDASQLA